MRLIKFLVNLICCVLISPFLYLAELKKDYLEKFGDHEILNEWFWNWKGEKSVKKKRRKQ